MTTTLSHYYILDRDEDLILRQPTPIETFFSSFDSNPLPICKSSSGSSKPIITRVSAKSGLSAWLESILYAPTDTCSLTSPDVPRALAEIQDTFSLSTVQLATVLGISRQTIYDWNEGKSVKPENRQRIALILSYAEQWKSLYSKPMGKIVSETLSSGTSLFDLLSTHTPEEKAVSTLFSIIVTKLTRATHPISARELAAKHNIQPLSEENHRSNLQLAHFRRGRKG